MYWYSQANTSLFILIVETRSWICLVVNCGLILGVRLGKISIDFDCVGELMASTWEVDAISLEFLVDKNELYKQL